MMIPTRAHVKGGSGASLGRRLIRASLVLRTGGISIQEQILFAIRAPDVCGFAGIELPSSI